MREARIRPSEVGELASALFSSGRGKYVGIESNLPSVYFKLYPTYLDSHADYIKRYPNEENTRILVVDSPGDLRDEFYHHREEYEKFVNWHKEHGVELRYVKRSTAVELMRKWGLPTTDIALWSRSFAVLFKPNDTYVTVRLVDRGEREFQHVQNYVKGVLKSSVGLKERLPSPMPREVVKKWRGYVGNDRQHTTCPLLERIFGEFRSFGWILDAAPGLGDELFCLIEKGFNVDANEADEEFRTYLWEEASRRNMRLNIYGYDWRELSELGTGRYAGIYLIGNDLSMLRSMSDRRKALRNFHTLLAQGGRLVVDTRNYRLIEECLRRGRGVCDYDREIGRRVMYTGKGVRLRLRRVGNAVRFEFLDTSTGRLIDTIDTYPLYPEQLEDMLRNEGFTIEEIYYDLRKDKIDKPEFVTYVARKTQEE